MGAGLFLAGLLFLNATPALSRQDVERQARELGMGFRDEFVILPTSPTSQLGAAQEAAVPGTDHTALPGQAPALQQDGREVMRHVIIPPGSTPEEIASLLVEQGVVDRDVFLSQVEELQVSRNLKAGEYDLPAGSDVAAVIQALTR